MNIEDDFAAIDWSRVQRPAGYSGAERIPNIIRELLNETDAAKIQDLNEFLYLHLTYNGGVGESTLVTIPILLKLLASKDIKRKGWLIRILGHLRFQSLDDDDLKKKLYESMLDGMPLFHQYLGHRFPEYRLMASQTLSRFIHHPDLVSNWLCQAIAVEPKLDIKIKMIEHLGSLLHKNADASVQTLQETLNFLLKNSMHGENYIRSAALNAYLRIAEEKTPEHLIDQLFNDVKRFGSRKRIEIDLVNSILTTFCDLETRFRFDLLLRTLAVTKSAPIASFTGGLLEKFYLRSLISRDRHFVTELTTIQKQILQVLLANDLYWKGRGNFNLNYYGLAKNRSDLRLQVKNATIVE